MTQDMLLSAALIGLVFLLAGIVKGVSGMGLPTVAMALLGALLSPVAAAGLLVLPSLATNLQQALAGPDLRGLLRRFRLMFAATALTALFASGWLAKGDARLTAGILGGLLMAYAAYALFAPPLRIPPEVERRASPLVGVATGLATGGAGIFVMPAAPWLQALGLGKEELTQALGLSFAVSTLALAAGLALHGAYGVGNLGASVLALAPATLGMWIGGILRRHASPALFRRVFLISLAVLGAEMLSRLWR